MNFGHSSHDRRIMNVVAHTYVTVQLVVIHIVILVKFY